MGAEMLVPDLVHLHWVSDFVDYPATLSMIPRSTPLVWTLHDMGVFTGGCSYSFECRGFEDQCGVCPQQAEIQAATRSSYWRRAKALQTVRDRLVLVSPSEWLASEARQSSLMKNVPCHVIRNGLDLSIFHPDLRLAARQHFQFEGDDVVLLFAAAALETPVKGMSILRGALESMHRDRRFRICFVGAGVPDGYPTDWRWLGETKSDQEIAAIYAAADMLVVPSLAENLPNVICESLACGTPVIGSNVGGIPELVIDGKTGYLFECEDAAGLARRIDQMMIEAKTNRQAWSKRCRDFAEQFLDIDACVQSHLELYDSLLQPPSG
jgi:glycosyltransferase involved in cell wall biosynthesis